MINIVYSHDNTAFLIIKRAMLKTLIIYYRGCLDTRRTLIL